MNDVKRQANYKQHRLRIQKATSLVDSQAPKRKPTTEESKNYKFLELFKSLARMSRDKTSNQQQPVRLQDLKKDLADSKDFPIAGSIKDFPIPSHVRQRYEQMILTQDWNLVQNLLRPCIYLDLQDIKGQPLGRLVIQLFTEACPQVVLQFVRSCLAKKPQHFNITRLVTPLWLEAELVLADKNALTSSTNMEHDTMAINHGSSAGILSFPSRYLRGSKLNFITFTVSFTPINVLNGKRIAFGIVKGGHKLLEHLQSFEVTRSGKPCKNVAVSACGICY